MNTELFKFYTAGQGKVTAEVCSALGNEIYPSVHDNVGMLYEEFTENAKKLLFINKNGSYVLPIAGTGSLAMEILLCNVVDEKETIMLSNNGFFSNRLSEIAIRHNANVHVIDCNWGDIVTVEDVKQAYKESGARVLYLVHGETSTGVLQPIAEIGEFCRQNNIVLLLDCSTTIGGAEFRMTEWNVNGAFTISQKCLATSPGVSIIAVDDVYVDKLSKRKKVMPFYLDLKLLIEQWYAPKIYHHTHPYSLLNSLNTSMKHILNKGIESEWRRYREVHDFVTSQIEMLGMELFVCEKKYCLPQLITCMLPDGNNNEFVYDMKNIYNIYLSKGLGKYQSNMIRVGLLGDNSQKTEVIYLTMCMLAYFSKRNKNIDIHGYMERINDFGGSNG